MNIKQFTLFWLSKCVLKTISQENLITFRKPEKNQRKLSKLKANLLFNETCLINNLLPTYTNIYIYIYIYIHYNGFEYGYYILLESRDILFDEYYFSSIIRRK